MDQQQQSRWRPTRRQLLWACGIVAVLTVVIGYRYGITLWDWAKLLIVPAVIAAGGLWFNTQQRDREQRTAERRAQDDALQAYLDRMSQLLTDKETPLHSAQPGDSLSTVAQAHTTTVLGRLDGNRMGIIVQFLCASGLIKRRHNIISLDQADLSGAYLYRANLRGANLYGANLIGANLYGANLNRADLSGADLSGADLSRADLSEADLSGTDLSRANLYGANLIGADLHYARGVTNEQFHKQLSAAYSLEGATMPNGQTLRGDKMSKGPTLEEWLKSKDREDDVEIEDVENE